MALANAPDHLTLWPLNLTGNSAIQSEIAAGILTPPDDELIQAMRSRAAERLTSLGYRAYTRVDYCLPGKAYRFRMGQARRSRPTTVSET